jgi:hypothetical protein
MSEIQIEVIMAEPENLVLTLLREVRGDVKQMREAQDHMATNLDVASVRLEVGASEKRLSERINHLNRAVMEYHSSAVGHGLLFTEIEERLRRVEQHLKLPPSESH